MANLRSRLAGVRAPGVVAWVGRNGFQKGLLIYGFLFSFFFFWGGGLQFIHSRCVFGLVFVGLRNMLFVLYLFGLNAVQLLF